MALKQNSRRVWFAGKRVYVKDPPRTGKCMRCGAIRVKTHMHHKRYGKTPLAFTKELCPSCHAMEHHDDIQGWEFYNK